MIKKILLVLSLGVLAYGIKTELFDGPPPHCFPSPQHPQCDK